MKIIILLTLFGRPLTTYGFPWSIGISLSSDVKGSFDINLPIFVAFGEPGIGFGINLYSLSCTGVELLQICPSTTLFLSPRLYLTKKIRTFGGLSFPTFYSFLEVGPERYRGGEWGGRIKIEGGLQFIALGFGVGIMQHIGLPKHFEEDYGYYPISFYLTIYYTPAIGIIHIK